ncbi:LLM class F420-dependent oxidoreductase [Constrictibacter sp. MBR-5]|jgi:probable F420-dependent oxidoreductase|uniref:LLM class F420-dependent oxidoreductase n=1 Tax=Constrictibacter sp. MBR-5 TaxID=3156467 RepID=UPI003398C494
MRFGISFPQVEIGTDPAVIRDFAQAVEGLGYAHLTCIDHVLGAARPDPNVPWSKHYTRERMFHEPFVTLGFLAAVTKTLELAPAVMILPQRQTALVAKQAAEVDVLSGGRLRFGVGLGWNAVEYEAMGQNFRTRARRIREQAELLRLLWTQELVTFDGTFDKIHEAGLNPLPVQRPIPLWFGAFDERAVERAAQLSDGWFLNPRMRPTNEGGELIGRFRQWIRDAGRDPTRVGIDATIHYGEGDEDRWAEELAHWRAFGVTHVTFRTMDAGLPGVTAHIDAFRRFKEISGA